MLVNPDNKVLFEPVLINVEFQSSRVDSEKIKIFSDYKDYSKVYYGLPVLTVVVMTDGIESSELEYCRVESDVFRPYYITMSLDEITKRLKNLQNKISNQEILNDDEALDIVLLPMFSPKNEAKSITGEISNLFHIDKSLIGIFRGDIAYALSLMIRKYFDLTAKGKELLKLIKPDLENSRLRNVIDFEVDYMRKSLEAEIESKQKSIEEMSEALAEKDASLAEKDASLAEKDDEISNLKAQLAKMTLSK